MLGEGFGTFRVSLVSPSDALFANSLGASLNPLKASTLNFQPRLKPKGCTAGLLLAALLSKSILGGGCFLRSSSLALPLSKLYCAEAKPCYLGGSWVWITPIRSLLVTYVEDLGGL